MAAPQQPLVAFLRQLSIGLAVYRLFPGDLERSDLKVIAERIRQAAAAALDAGPVEVEIEGTGFRTAAGPLPSDEHLRRLARACYERGAQKLWLRSVPADPELDRLYRVLAMRTAEVLEAGGASELLEDAEVLGIGEVGPETSLAREQPVPDAPSGTTKDLDAVVAAAAEAEGEPEDIAAELLAQLRESVDPATPEGPDTYGRLHESVAGLPEPIRRAFLEDLIDKAMEDPVAERLVGTMTDLELAEVLAEVRRREPLDVARQLVDEGRRHSDLIELTAALLGVREAEVGGQGTVGGGPIAATVEDVLAGHLVAAEEDDIRAIRESFDEIERDPLVPGLTALGDYLIVEEDADRLGMVLDAWVDRVREALRSGDDALLSRLLDAVVTASDELPPSSERGALLARYRERVLDPPLVRELVSRSLDPDESGTRTLLARLGPAAVEPLFTMLEEERDRRTRLQLIDLLAGLVPDYLDRVVARLDDARWYVARNALTILQRSEVPGAVPLLARGLKHPEPPVRREAVWGLFLLAGGEAVSHLREAARDEDASVREAALTALGGLTGPEAVRSLVELVRGAGDRQLRLRALDELAKHSSPEARRALEGLARRGERPRPPWTLRRRARRLARERQGAAA